MRKQLIDRGHSQLSIRRQADLVSVNRNRIEVSERRLSADDLTLRRAIDELHLEYPVFGSRRLVVMLERRGIVASRDRVRRAMREMGIRATYRRPRTSVKSPENRVYPYLLRDLAIERPNQVWCSDITYIPMARGFGYLVVIMDGHSRAVLSWRMSNTLDTDFCVEALEAAREAAGSWPEIMNTDQGCQFTSYAWTSVLRESGVRISMDGKGRWIDNVMVERLWRSLKYEDIYLRAYQDLAELEVGLDRWLTHYNHDRPHQSLGWQTPMDVYAPQAKAPAA
ncbi:Integrase core domain protein [Planctomycetes bacterium Pla86]|uniref:Integrase core domain protein n=2 Tax=Engelhardtia mirabilis TaxID=2528011 RepID=A0A518BGZ0_9BACT|nr:Integrase core domain protein [Planctomycetes bacterium Pla133]QDV00553.1 Integrase core domain protein [Planctomycetes bacterium Pla86]